MLTDSITWWDLFVKYPATIGTLVVSTIVATPGVVWTVLHSRIAGSGAAMRSVSGLKALIMCATILVVSPPGLRAQAGGATMTCGAAQDLLLKSGGSAANIVWASRTIIRCGDIAPTTLIAALRKVAVNSLRDSVVQEAAWRLSDRRLVDSVIAYSKQSQQSVARRTLGLKLLTHYVDPMASLHPAGANEPMKIVLVTVPHGAPVLGNAPIASADQLRALDAIRWMSTNDPDAGIRAIATLAAKELDYRRAHPM
jgi:hypothetical protein